MPRDAVCDETRGMIAELALGIADGAERGQALEHVARCDECRRELDRQSAVADELLLLAPAEEPPLGFELEVLRAIQPEPKPGRRLARWLAPALAVLAAVAVTAAGMFAAFDDERRLADHYRATLERANGQYFGAFALEDAAGRQGGVVFTYRGSPSWVLVTVAPQDAEAIERAEVVADDGRRVAIESFRLVDGVWGGTLPLALGDVAAVELVSRDGRSQLIAKL